MISEHWLFSASTLAEPSMARSHDIGELALHNPTSTVLSRTNSSPKRILAMSTESWARSGWVTDAMYGLSWYLMCE